MVKWVKSNAATHCIKNEIFHQGFLSVNVTKSAGNCGFIHIYEKILNGKLHCLCSSNKILNIGNIQMLKFMY